MWGQAFQPAHLHQRVSHKRAQKTQRKNSFTTRGEEHQEKIILLLIILLKNPCFMAFICGVLVPAGAVGQIG